MSRVTVRTFGLAARRSVVIGVLVASKELNGKCGIVRPNLRYVNIV